MLLRRFVWKQLQRIPVHVGIDLRFGQQQPSGGLWSLAAVLQGGFPREILQCSRQRRSSRTPGLAHLAGRAGLAVSPLQEDPNLVLG